MSLMYLLFVTALSITCVSIETHDVIQPYGARMCAELCETISCQSPFYIKHRLTCYLNAPYHRFFTKGIVLSVRQHRFTKGRYRKVLSKSKGDIFIEEKTSVNNPRHKVPKGYKKARVGKVYVRIKLRSEKLSWSDGFRVCQSEGARLFKMDTKEKLFAVRRVFRKEIRAPGKFKWWIGMRYFKEDDKFQWIDGDHLTFAIWRAGEPKHSVTKSNGEVIQKNCAVIDKDIFGLLLRAMPCKAMYKFLCERL